MLYKAVGLLAALAFSGQAAAVTVNVDFYSDSSCSNNVNTITYDMGNCDATTGECDQECMAWTRTVINDSPHDDSARYYECFADWGILYRQWVESDVCEGMINWEDKEARFGCCIQEPSGNLYSKLAESQRTNLEGCAPATWELAPEGDCTSHEDYVGVEPEASSSSAPSMSSSSSATASSSMPVVDTSSSAAASSSASDTMMATSSEDVLETSSSMSSSSASVSSSSSIVTDLSSSSMSSSTPMAASSSSSSLWWVDLEGFVIALTFDNWRASFDTEDAFVAELPTILAESTAGSVAQFIVLGQVVDPVTFEMTVAVELEYPASNYGTDHGDNFPESLLAELEAIDPADDVTLNDYTTDAGSARVLEAFDASSNPYFSNNEIACSELPCSNGGVCSVVEEAPYFECACPSTHTGDLCETAVTTTDEDVYDASATVTQATGLAGVASAVAALLLM